MRGLLNQLPGGRDRAGDDLLYFFTGERLDPEMAAAHVGDEFGVFHGLHEGLAQGPRALGRDAGLRHDRAADIGPAAEQLENAPRSVVDGELGQGRIVGQLLDPPCPMGIERLGLLLGQPVGLAQLNRFQSTADVERLQRR